MHFTPISTAFAFPPETVQTPVVINSSNNGNKNLLHAHGSMTPSPPTQQISPTARSESNSYQYQLSLTRTEAKRKYLLYKHYGPAPMDIDNPIEYVLYCSSEDPMDLD